MISINTIFQNDICLSANEIKKRLLNEKNIPITKKYINSIFKRVGFAHEVIYLENFQRAMIHTSYLVKSITNPKIIKLLKDIIPINSKYESKCMPLCTHSYERLEYLGDSILRHAIGKYLFLRYPDKEEGFLTTNRSKMENKYTLSNLARKLGLQKYAVISRHIEQANARTTYITLTEDIFEAFLGALNLEVGENKTIEFIWKIIEHEYDVPETIRTKNNYKDQLMQYFHKFDTVKHDLKYTDEEIDTDDCKKRYVTIVSDKNTGIQLGIGYGRSKKSAQQRSAKDALIKLNLIGQDSEQEDDYFDYSGNIEKEIENIKNIYNTI
jgi:ribonuclease-3